MAAEPRLLEVSRGDGGEWRRGDDGMVMRVVVLMAAVGGVRGGDDDVATVEEGGWRSDVVAAGQKSAGGWPDPAMAPEKEREEMEAMFFIQMP
ncbi:hypothetical protein Tco_1068258 [Tanacetum coccineum]|uniref:Uncharacterized protein n=1 Tax=Tanacetum coccineum TaxID=301880 RepID=A0ABQ5HFD9_9ASTR